MEVIKSLISHKLLFHENVFTIFLETVWKFASSLVQTQQLGVQLVQKEGTEFTCPCLQMPAKSATKFCT